MPNLGLYRPEPGVVAGLLALIFPVTVVPLARGLGRSADQRWPERLFLATTAGLIALGLLMAESFSSLLAVAGMLAAAGWWWLASRLAGGRRQSLAGVWGVGIAAAVVAAGVALVAVPDLPTVAFGALPGLNGAEERLAVYAQVWRLAQDTPFTGAGLAAFPGYYSTYILGIPFLFLDQAHNAYLSILLEQGWLGLLSFVALLATCLVAATRQWQGRGEHQRMLALAGGLGVMVVMLHGLGEGTLVASWGALALLVPAGLSAEPMMPTARGTSGQPGRRAAAAVVVLCLAAAVGLTWRTWLSAWHANWGTLEFARVQLAEWPTEAWSTGTEAPRLAATRPSFGKALALNPNNVTANYRLGLLAGLERDFAGARQHLSLAHAADPGHRGILKALAYTYVWLGEIQLARPLLAQLPEAAGELSAFTWWWDTQGRADLASQAQAALEALERSTTP
jgi:O-antigen ligase